MNKFGWPVAALMAVVAAAAFYPALSAEGAPEPKRIGMVVGLKPDKIDEYVELHRNAWPEVLQAMKECNIRNFSIYLAEVEEGKHLLFGYYEYHGDDYAADMARLEQYPINKKWWALTDACQMPVPAEPGDSWTIMKEVFHMD